MNTPTIEWAFNPPADYNSITFGNLTFNTLEPKTKKKTPKKSKPTTNEEHNA